MNKQLEFKLVSTLACILMFTMFIGIFYLIGINILYGIVFILGMIGGFIFALGVILKNFCIS